MTPQSVVISLIALILLLAVAYFNPELLSMSGSNPNEGAYLPQNDRSDEIPGKLQVHFFDVGQGDASLVITPDGKTVMIDAGPNSDQDRLLSYLEALKIKTIDYMIFTHPHEDHIGGGDAVIDQYSVGTVIMPDASSSSSTFEKLLLTIDKKNVPIELAAPGDTYQISDCSFTVYGPITIPDDDANNASIILRLVWNNTSVLFSGDAESKEEAEVLLKYASKLKSDVYQVGHHGSSTSSSEAFLQAIDPDIAVISCAKDNEYGHPHKETINLLSSLGVKIYRTDLQGSILLLSDGEKVS